MEERRRYTRIPVEAKIAYAVIPDVRIREHATKDICRGGIQFFVHDLIPVGSHVKVRMTLPGPAGACEALVKVVWAKQSSSCGERYDVGGRFVDMPRDVIERFIDRIESFSAGA